MAAPKKQDAFVDLSNDDDDKKKNNTPRKPRTSLVHDRPQNLKCWICGKGVMVHKKISMVRGKHGCIVCGQFCERDKLTYCTHSECTAVWCRGCWRQQNHINQRVARMETLDETKDD